MAKVVLKLGSDISTDAIYPGRYMATVLPTETPQYAFADAAEFNERLRQGRGPAIEASEGDELELRRDEVVNRTTGKRFPIVPLPEARQAIVDAGGLIPYARP